MSIDTAQAEKEKWLYEIKPKRGWFEWHLEDLWNYRDLILLFVRRDFVSQYKQTVLGPLWYLIQPIFTTITFTIVFSRIAGISTSGLPPILFYLSGLTAWNYFADCLNKTSQTFVANAGMFGKVYFPRLAVPVSIVISSLITFAFQFLLFVVVLLYYHFSGAISIQLNSTLFLFPLLVAMMALLGLGSGIVVSALTTKYRDLRFLMNFGVQLLMYATPVIYPMDSIQGKLKTVISFNPMSSIVETMRYIFMGTGELNFGNLIYSGTVILIILVSGLFIFNRVERNFMDTV
jgi:lipopolysaccharide transport system permease protein